MRCMTTAVSKAAQTHYAYHNKDTLSSQFLGNMEHPAFAMILEVSMQAPGFCVKLFQEHGPAFFTIGGVLGIDSLNNISSGSKYPP